MSHPTRALVTIDDRVTIIEPHRVLLEYVEIVHRDGFHVRSQKHHPDSGRGGGPPFYRHEDEGTTWARGHHVPDSEVVDALYAAVRLAPPTLAPPATKNTAQSIDDLLDHTGIATPDTMMKDLVHQAREEMEKARRFAEQAAPKWWRSRAHR